MSKQTLIVHVEKGWLSSSMWPMKDLPNEIRLIFIGHMNAAQGNFGDFSTRVGIQPNHFTGWEGPKRPIAEVRFTFSFLTNSSIK